MDSKIEFPVFTETNLGTRIAIAVSPEITAGVFKGEVERAHIGCFPELGFLKVDAVMVKKNSYFYHLPDLLPLKHVFRGSQGAWLLYVNAALLNNFPKINNGTEVCQKTKKKKRRKKRPKVKKLPENFSCRRVEQESLEPRGDFSSVNEREENNWQETQHATKEPNSNATAESPCGSVVSVSGIINRYFTDFVNLDLIGDASSSIVTPRNAQCDVENLSYSERGSKKQSPVRTHKRLLSSLLPENSNSIARENRYERSEVGERFVVASNNLGNSRRVAVSKCKQLQNSDSGSMIRRLVFEIDGNSRV